MKRYLRGMVLLGVSATLWACNTESTAVEGGEATRLVVDPAAMFIEQGEVKTVLVRTVDQQGGALDAPVTIGTVGSGITVEADSGFRPIYNAGGELIYNTFNHELRLLVTGNDLASTSFDISAGEFSETITVVVLPPVLAGTLSNANPAINEVITLTAPEGFTFAPTSTISFQIGDNDAEILGVAADGSSIDFRVFPGSAGAITVSDVTPGYHPSLSIPFENENTVSLAAGGLPGSDDPSTGPIINAPAMGESITLIDFPNGEIDQFYRIVTTDPDTRLEISSDWGGSADIDAYLCDATCGSVVAQSAGSDHPEVITTTLATAGTYALDNNVYSGAPTYFYITVTRVPLPAP